MITRLVIMFALIVFGVVAYMAATRWQTARIGRLPSGSAVLSGLNQGVPAVIYFWSEACGPCKTVQSPALKQLEAELGPESVQVVAINAVDQPTLASEWGVLSLPTTFIVDRTGQPRHVNHGVTRAEQLRKQIATFG
jgi:thiol-disulfide isomerase/thioredoxin